MKWRAPVSIFLVALAAHVAFVYALPESWGDGYFHMMGAWDTAREIREGTFHPSHLVSAWLPFFHVECALPLLVWNDPLHVPRLVSALLGAATVALVFAVVRKHFADPPWLAALAAFFLLASPYHLFFSSYAMTEITTEFFIVLALAAFLKSDRGNRWLLAVPIALAPAMLTRYEPWLLAGVIWIVAILQKRASVGVGLASAGLFALPALFWLGMNYAATGDAFHFYRVAANYMNNYFYVMYPESATRSFQKTVSYFSTLAVVSGLPLLYAFLGAIDARRREAAAVLAFGGGYVAILMLLYVKGSNAGWLRYWVPAAAPLAILGAMGVDAVVRFTRATRPKLVAAAFAVLALAGFVPIFFQILPSASWSKHQLEIGEFIRAHPPKGRVFCDEAAVILASGLPHDRFVDNTVLTSHEPDEAIRTLRGLGVDLVVWSGVDYSPMQKIFPELRGPAVRSRDFELVFDPPTNHTVILPSNLHPTYLYRLR